MKAGSFVARAHQRQSGAYGMNYWGAATSEDLKQLQTWASKSDWWNAKWIPFTYDGAGNHYSSISIQRPAIWDRLSTWYDDDDRALMASSFRWNA